jgi:hypothetical protein
VGEQRPMVERKSIIKSEGEKKWEIGRRGSG